MGRSRAKVSKGLDTGNATMARLKRTEKKLEKKKEELLQVKALHRKIAGEFIDLWLEAKRLKRKR